MVDTWTTMLRGLLGLYLDTMEESGKLIGALCPGHRWERCANMYLPFLVRGIYSESHLITFCLWRLKTGLVHKLDWYQSTTREMTRRSESENLGFSCGSTKIVLLWEICFLLWVSVAYLSNKDIVLAWECFETQIHLWMWRSFEKAYL